MKQAYGTHKASKVSPQARISNMPENVITHILECLPIKEAVTTGILSRNRRYNWTNISQLVFDEKFFVPGLDGGNNCSERTISRLLLHLKGVVTKFVLFIQSHKILDVEEVYNWVLFLSRKGIREFTVINNHPKVLKLPTHLFTCLELKHLKLYNCCFHVPPGLCVFPNLLNIDFTLVEIKSQNIGEFISWCPLLEILKISSSRPSSKVKLVEITKLENLKVLSLPLHDLENIAIKISDTFELDGLHSKLEKLDLDFENFKATKKDVVPPPLPVSSLECLEVHYTKMRKLQLHFVLFTSFRGSESEVCLIKCILACSPSLKRITIFPGSFQAFGGEKGKLMFASKLLELPRASTIDEVNIDWSHSET